MGRSYEVKTAGELLDTGRFTAKWQARRELDALARGVLWTILERLVAGAGPVAVETVATLLPKHDPTEIYEAIARLDEKDLILVQDEQVTLAYPFAGAPTAFEVVLPDGEERHAVCANVASSSGLFPGLPAW